MSHRLIRLHPRSLTLSGQPIHVARIPAAPFPWAPFSLTHDLPSSFALSGLPVHLANSQPARFSLDGIVHSHEIPRRTSLRGLARRRRAHHGRLLPLVDHYLSFVCAREYCRERAFAVSRRFPDRAGKFTGNHRALASITPDKVQFEDHFNRLTRRCSEPRTVLMPSFKSIRTSILTRAVVDLGSR